MSDRPKVLVLGAGFAGVGAARKMRKAPVDVLLVDRHDYHTFQPLLYQVATDVLDAPTVGHPVREYVDEQDNLRFVMAEVSGIDLERRVVSFKDWEDQSYDMVVVALGAKVNFFDTPGAAEHSFPLYTLIDALRLKNRVLENFEAAAKRPQGDAAHRLDVVVVGGGPTGVETVGALAELYHRTMAHDAPELSIGDASITIVDHGDRLLKMFDEGMSDYTREVLEERGVTVRLGEKVDAIDAESVTLGSGEVLHAPTTVWAAGLKASPLAASLVEPDQLRHGRVPVGPMLQLDGHPEVFVAGDLAWISDGHDDGDSLPQLGSVALQSGEHIGRTIDRIHRRHKEPEPFSYLDKGTMATIGRGAAVAVVPPGVHLTGRPAFAMWGAVHLALMGGGDSRAAALVNWFWALTKGDRPSRILLHPDDDD